MDAGIENELLRLEIIELKDDVRGLKIHRRDLVKELTRLIADGRYCSCTDEGNE